MDQTTIEALKLLDPVLSALCIKVQGFELTHIIHAPADQQWAVRGQRDDPDNKLDIGQQAVYPAAKPSDAILAALAANP